MTPLERLVREQKDRVVETLVTQLPGKLADLLSEEPAALAALVPTPQPADYWVVRALDVEQLLLHTDVAIVVSSSRATTYPTRLTGTRRAASLLTRSYLTITAHLRPAVAYAQIERRGRALRERELLELIADIYRGAILSTLLEWATDGAVILDVALTSDYSETLGSDATDGARGRAAIEIELAGHASHSTPQYTLTREAP